MIHNHGPKICPEWETNGRIKAACTSREWSVAKHGGEWRVLLRGYWYDSYPTLHQAHTAATALATIDWWMKKEGLR
jgi:hypothetical protein